MPPWLLGQQNRLHWRFRLLQVSKVYVHEIPLPCPFGAYVSDISRDLTEFARFGCFMLASYALFGQLAALT
jgi:hypothetical protein